jgi:hypothetical protein
MPHTRDNDGEITRVLAVHAFLDSKAETVISRLWQHAETLEVDIDRPPVGVRPHLTLGSWKVGELPEGLSERIAAAFTTVPCISLRLVLRLAARQRAYFSLAPLVQHELLQWHEGIHRQIGALGTRCRAADFPGQWNPHLTLFNCDEGDLAGAYGLLKCLPLPLKAEVASIGLMVYTRDEPVRSVVTVRIGQA